MWKIGDILVVHMDDNYEPNIWEKKFPLGYAHNGLIIFNKIYRALTSY